MVSDEDFSYITADDLRKHQAEQLQQEQQSSELHANNGPTRPADSLIIRHQTKRIALRFPAHSIADGELTVRLLRSAVAKSIGASDEALIKLIYRGKILKDDRRTCKEEGLRDGAELRCIYADEALPDPDSDSEDGRDDRVDGDSNDPTGVDSEEKRRRNRGKKSYRRNKRQERESNLGAPPLTQESSRSQSPSVAKPQTPMEKLDALHQTLQSYKSECLAFAASPPTDPAKKTFEHKRLSEMILTQVLLKLDAIETEGDVEARNRRKEVVNETQLVLKDLDESMK